MLEESVEALVDASDLAMLDLDGVVYVGGEAVPGAPAFLRDARSRGMHLAFVTNNAARPPEAVAAHLNALGVQAEPGDVVTSAQAAASVLRERWGEGTRVAVLGAAGLLVAVAEAGLSAVGVDEDAEALVTGYGPDVRWRDIMRAAVRIRDGLPWVASNTDASIPSPYGEAPGHGVLVDLLSRFSGVTPTVAGKPAPPLLEETMRRVGGERPLMVGDRLDTDIAGGRAVDVPTLLVLTGVTGLQELVSATEELRPTYVAPDLGGLLEAHPVPTAGPAGVTLGGWQASVADGELTVEGSGSLGDWWRVVATAAWRHLDAVGTSVGLSGVTVPDAETRSPAGSLRP